MNCRVCDSTRLELVVDLGEQPWCNHFLKKEEVGKEPFYPLRVVFCHDCSTSQLDHTVPKEVMFGDHTYLSGVTRSLSAHFEGIARQVDERFMGDRTGKSVLDIGSNDGTQLKHFIRRGYDILGVESSKGTAAIARENGVETVNEFFNEELVRRFDRKFDVINAAGVFFHLEELHSAAEGVRLALADDGVFVIQFLYMQRIMENLAFDQIYHEHLLYYNLATLGRLLDRHGMEIFDAYLAPIHGGSMIAFVTHKGRRAPSAHLKALLLEEQRLKSNDIETYRRFAERVKGLREKNRAYLLGARDQGKRIWGMGAPVKGNTLLNYFDIGPETIEYLVEKNELRRNLFSPGKHIPVVIEKEQTEVPDIYYVLAWNFKKEILANNRHLVERGVEFYFPIDPERTLDEQKVRNRH